MKKEITKEKAAEILKEEGEDLLSIWETGLGNNYDNDGNVEEDYANWNAPTREEMEERLLEETKYFFDEEEKKLYAENEITGFAFVEIELSEEQKTFEFEYVGADNSSNKGKMTITKIGEKYTCDSLSYYNEEKEEWISIDRSDATQKELEQTWNEAKEIIEKERKTIENNGKKYANEKIKKVNPVLLFQNTVFHYSGEAQKEGKNKSSHLVRGHFRNQPFGKERTKNKIIWIEPFFKGMNPEEASEKKYIV